MIHEPHLSTPNKNASTMRIEDGSQNIIMNKIGELRIGNKAACNSCKVCVHLDSLGVDLDSLTPDTNTPLTLLHGILDEVHWLSLCKRVRFAKEAHENEDEDEDEDDYTDCYRYIDYTDPVSIVKRPKTIHAPIPFAELPDLGIHGQYRLLDSYNKDMPVSHIMFAASVRTTASVILLAPNDVIHKDLVCLNRESKYLVLRVSWDRLSYFFLRTLRTSYPDIPIVAVTDLDPHHLDLLTFLDTPLETVRTCYGWNLSRDFEDVFSTDIDFVEIKWLGLRHTDCEGRLLWEGGDARPPPGFDEVICMLRVNPFLRDKKDWLEALDWLHVFGKSVTLHPPAPADPPGGRYLRLGDDFIANKLSKKDWV